MVPSLLGFLTIAIAATSVLGHAVVKVPTPRGAGSYYTQRCGKTYAEYMEKDRAGPIEDGVAKAGADLKCNAFLCRGYQYEDNSATEYKPGQVIDFKVDLIAGHRPGYANVSIVDLANNKIIGSPLRSWDSYPNATATTPRSDINFNVTIPRNLGTVCSTGGKCAIQWYWYATRNQQTYESCVDFYVKS
ncbi:hypothetical protein N657DRAFT_103004 [Parathielavia appendiculata]|uniref:Chitin-binding type-4 domain-containing protein n=1 Tax=Parathielavia appendiculata TaxID=2587402 RepID=A0AAN6TXE3_9PEZI|nr:hypothetical protein N657DRAFT_103004 [Parathielavia appendiculata]